MNSWKPLLTLLLVCIIISLTMKFIRYGGEKRDEHKSTEITDDYVELVTTSGDTIIMDVYNKQVKYKHPR